MTCTWAGRAARLFLLSILSLSVGTYLRALPTVAEPEVDRTRTPSRDDSSMAASDEALRGSPLMSIIEESADPLENDSPVLAAGTQTVSFDPTNIRHAHLAYEYTFVNGGPGMVDYLEVYIAIPSSRVNQLVYDSVLSPGNVLLVDRYGQQVAHYRYDDVLPNQPVTVTWQGDVEIVAFDYELEPDRVLGLDHVPADIADVYTTNELMYRLESPIIQAVAQEAAAGATNPYWIARNIHDYVANRLSYVMDGRWDDAETVYLQQHGSCSEYTILYIALCRENGLPARYVGGTRQRDEGTYVDTVFHRWAEVYLPGYGWVPVDVTHDDVYTGVVHTYFGATSNERLVTGVGGGGSEYLWWNYISTSRFASRETVSSFVRDRRYTWEPYPSELRVKPESILRLVMPDSSDVTLGYLDVLSTNGAYAWVLDTIPAWLGVGKTGGDTPDTVQVVAHTEGLELGVQLGDIQFSMADGSNTAAVRVELRAVETIHRGYLPAVMR